ncbi:hypothetical protein AB833_19770 [Chromatiales bacterium (ex Bugula neritina AB1)]|nr:hypothetical protein AB833_19770 [Chromatiales bacterium (ex Bugula neritina AB1)]
MNKNPWHSPPGHSLLVLLATTLMLATLTAQAGNGKSVAFFYGPNPPVNALSQFDRLILESENVKPDELQDLKRNNSTAFAYLSVGEVGPHRNWFNTVPQAAILADNPDWNTKVMDLTSARWQRFLLQRVTQLVNAGYDGLFLDTMDSYQLAVTTDEQRKAQQDSLANLLYRIKNQHPDIRMIVNRGFEVMDKISPYIEAVAAESLYAGWNNAEQQYLPVPIADRTWLQGKLEQIRLDHNLDIIIVDYLPPSRRSDARDTAAQIAGHGFIPWIANPSLDYVGLGSMEVIPRDVIMLYDSRQTGDLVSAEVHMLLAMPLEYMGYVPQYHDIATAGLPSGVLKGSYAGIVAWNRGTINVAGYPEWLHKQLIDQMPLAMIGSLGSELSATLTDLLGLQTVAGIDQLTLTPLSSDELISFEAPVPPRIDQISMGLRSTSSLNTTHLSFEDRNNTRIDTVITGPWGGLALHPTVLDSNIDSVQDWIIDPFAFLKKSLKLTDAPMPDITTENGKRLWFAHIDGDAMPSWAELPGRRLGSQVILDEVIVPYDLPHTVSVVEAEINSLDQFQDRRELMVQTARELFALDNVEIASHSYSHPFDWAPLKEGSKSGAYNLPVPGYRFRLQREIEGSVEYIDKTLAPPGKKTEVMLWTGTAIAPQQALGMVEQLGLVNMNGGNTVISKARPTVTTISPSALPNGNYLQIYAPIMNENIFTNEWTGPFDGFRRVIETLELTDKPRRIKPANVYYHFYIGTKMSSLRSLQEVYNWSVKQEIFPVFASDYLVKVPHFRSAGVARYLDGRWKISGLGPIRSLRTLKNNAWPDLTSSSAVTGARALHDGVYIHTDGTDTFSFRTQSTQPAQPHLVAANGRIDHWRKNRNGQISFRLSGQVPVVLTLSGDRRFCQMQSNDVIVPGRINPDGNTTYEFSKKDTGDAVIDCQT